MSKKTDLLAVMQSAGGQIETTGLDVNVVARFLDLSPALGTAIDRAYEYFTNLKSADPDFVALDEARQVELAQAGITNFYAVDSVNPYVAAGAAGPWIVTLKGAVIYDCGGYGMLGFGHAPEAILNAMNSPYVMANIMTPSVSQKRFINTLRGEVGHRRSDEPFASFQFLNSGSEANSLASRIADINTRLLTNPGARHEGKKLRGLSLIGSFHGRTARPAKYSDSTLPAYREHLASFKDDGYLITVEADDVLALEQAFASADQNNEFIEAMFLEPVMGEGDPGRSISAEFYARARALTRQHGTMLIIDSIQAGLRAEGVLSIVDYEGFEDLGPPDMESWSKALNGGQFPLSVLALSQHCADIFQTGVYGNTMTANPRAMEVAVAVLESLTPDVRQNIRRQGAEFVARLNTLGDETDGAITGAQGTGLLFSCELAERYKIYGTNSTEDYLRRKGLGVIHGGPRSLRFTPRFAVTSEEIDLVVALLKDALANGPQS